MKNTRPISGHRGFTLLMAGALVFSAALVWSADQLWLFQKPDQMRAEIKKYVKSPRSTYSIIVRARTLGLSNEAALTYRGLLMQQRNDPYLQAAYAFSQFIATGRGSSEEFMQHPAHATTKLQNLGGEAQYYRMQAVEALPNSSVVLLETARGLFYTTASTGKQARPWMQKALAMARKTVKLDPKWASARYNLAEMLQSYSMNQGDSSSRITLAQEALANYQQAEQLDKHFRPNCLVGYAGAYDDLKQWDKALENLNAYIKLNPEAAKRVSSWHESLVRKVEKK